MKPLPISPLKNMTGLLLVMLFFTSLQSKAQLSLTSTGSPVVIDFSTALSGVCTTNFAINSAAAMMASTPGTGQLDADAWAITADGATSGAVASFPGSLTANFATLSSAGSASTGWGASNISSDREFAVLPSGSQATPGSLTLKIVNNTGSTLSELVISYSIRAYNDQGRANKVELWYSADNTSNSYTEATAAEFVSTATSNTSFEGGTKSATISNLSIANGGTYFIRWFFDDVSGSGSRDEFYLDDISITGNAGTPTISVTGTLTEFTTTATNTASSEQSISVSGSNLTNNISIAPPTGFEISTGTGGGFSATNPITLTQSGGTVSSTTIYVRYNPSALNQNGGNITCSSTGASTQNVAASGYVNNLSVGDVAVISVDATNDIFALVALADIPANTQLKITDRGWDGSLGTPAFTSGENFGVWTAPGSTVSKGTVITFTSSGNTVSTGTMSAAMSGFSTSGDQVLVYQGTDVSPQFKAALSTSAFISSGTPTTNQTWLPSGLTAGTNALGFAATGGNTFLTTGTQIRTLAGHRSHIHDSTNWTQNSTSWPTYAFTILADEPTTQPSFSAATGVGNNGMTLNFSGGNGASYIVVMKQGSAVTGTPNDQTSYTGSLTFGSGNTITTGEYVVYSGSTATTSAAITNLNPGTTYHYAIFAFNGSGSTLNYLTTSPGTGNETTTGTANSSSSNIIVHASFTEPTNIDYAATQENSNLTTGNSVEVAKFTLQDGGGSADGDANSTTLTAISFTVANHGNLRRLALYDGSTELSEISVAGSTATFSSLTLAASDDGTKDFSIRASFKSTVTDNDQFSFTVSSATADVAGSTFAAANAGGAASSTSGDRNKIEVNATVLAFVQQPTAVLTGVSMSPAVTVSANDGNGNRDLDYTTDMSITSTGTLTGSPVIVTPSAGLGTFSSLVHTAAGTGRELYVTSGSLTDDTSSTFTVTLSPTTLAVGDISLLGFNTNSPDNFSFVTWVDLNNNTLIKFTDNGFLSSGSATGSNNARGGEAFVIWKNNTGNTIPAGTVIKVEGVTATTGEALAGSASGLNGISSGSDQIFAYQGSATSGSNPDWNTNSNPTTFTGTILYGLNIGGNWLTTGSPSSSTSYLPSELNVTNGNIVFTSAQTGEYTGSRINQPTYSQFRTLVTDPSNWTTAGSGTTGLSTTAFTTGTSSVLANITTQPSGSIYQGASEAVLTGFKITPNAAINFTQVTVTKTGTTSGSDITTVKIYRDNDGNGAINGGDADVSGGGVSLSGSMNLTISGESGFSAVRNYLIVAVVDAGATIGNTINASVASAAFTTEGTTTDTTFNTGSCSGNTRPIALAPGTSTMTAGAGSEPASFAATVNSQGAASLNFDITITDDGATSSTDAIATELDELVFRQGTGNTATDWTAVIAGAELNDGTNSMTGTVNTDNIAFSSISNNSGELGHIADDATKTYTLKVWLHSNMGSLKTSIDGKVLVFRITSADVSANTGSQLTATEDQNSGSSNNEIEVSTTALAYIQNASNVFINTAMSPAVTVEAVDANGNRDLDFVDQIRITSSGTLTGTPVDVNASAGLATFSSLTHTAGGTGLSLNAERTATTDLDVSSSSFNVTSVTEVILPQYAINGNTSASRLQYACRLTLSGLSSNATYRYLVSASTNNALTTTGPGNMFAINNSSGSAGYITGYTSAKSVVGQASEFSSDEFSSSNRYATFTTDGSGNYTGWFAFVPTSNAVFTAGNGVYFYVHTNNGTGAAGDTAITQNLRTTNTITMLDYTNAKPIAGTSHAPAEHFVFTYDNTSGTGRPLYGSWTENDGISTTFTTWYSSTYDGAATSFGTIAPSSLANGIRRIAFYEPDGDALYAVTSTDGTWNSVNTVNPSAGTTPLVIARTVTGTAGDFMVSNNTSLAASLTVNGDLALASGTLTTGSNTLTVDSTLSRTSGNIDASAGTLAFTNTAAITLPGSLFADSLNNLTLNGSGGVNMSENINVKGATTLTTGVLSTGGSNSLIMGGNATVSETGTAYIDGNLQTTRTLLQSTTHTFGGMGLSINETTQSTNSYLAIRRTGVAISSGNSGFSGNEGIKRYFSITPTTNSGLNAQVVFSYREGELNGIAEGDLRVYVHVDPYTNDSWEDLGGKVNINTTNNTVSNDVDNPISHFSTWSFGDNADPLPLQLIAFGAKHEGEANRIRWTTAAEINMATYEVQRSADGQNFETVTTLPARNTTGTTTYTASDASPATSTYYRLRMVETDGSSSLSQTVLVQTGASPAVSLYPLPVSTVLNIEPLQTAEATIATLTAVDGKVLAIYTFSRLQTIDMSHLPTGLYLLRIETPASVQILKVLKN